jgi:hypothetical protein
MTSARSDRARRTAIRLLQWYPRPWRIRYEREMRALLEEMPVSWGQVVNLAGTAAREWMSPRALGWPARTAAGRVLGARLCAFLAIAYTLDIVARVMASQTAVAQFAASDAADSIGAYVLLALLLRVLSAGFLRLKRVRKSPLGAFAGRHPRLRHLSDWEVVVWLVALLPNMIVRHAVTPDYYSETMRTLMPYFNIYLVYMWTDLLVSSTAKRARLWKVQLASVRRPLGLSNQ